MKKLILRSSLIMVSLILLMFTVVFAQDVRQFVAQKVSFKVVVNGEEKTFNDPIVTIDNKTYVPLREVSNNLGLDVKWDANNQKIELNSKQTTSYDGLLPFAKDGLYGYMDQDGNIKIKPQFYRASYFSEGLAEVTKKEFGGIGFINEKGDVVIPYHDQWSRIWGFNNGIALVQTLEYPDMFDGDNKCTYMFIDKTGKQLFGKTFSYAESFKEGYAIVSTENNKYSFINEKGELTTNLKFEKAYEFCNGYAAVKNSGKWGLIDNKFNLIINFQYDSLGSVSKGLNLIAATKQGKSGFIDTKGNTVIEFKYDKVFSFSNNIAGVILNGKWYYINAKGETITGINYDRANGFYEDMASVYVDGKWGFIDTNGKLVIPAKFKYAMMFSEGVAVVQLDNKLWGAIDKKGEFVVEPKYKTLYDCMYGLMMAETENGEQIYVNQKGEEIKPK